MSTDLQLTELNKLLAYLRERSPFFQKRLGSLVSVSSVEEFSLKVPLLSKDDLWRDREESVPYGSGLTLPAEAYSRFTQTSGSSGGKPMVFLDSQESWGWMLENWKQIYQVAGVDADDRIYFPFSFGPFLGFWTAFDAACEMGALTIPGGGLSTVGRLEGLTEHGATVICSTPTYALRMAEVAGEEGYSLSESSVRVLILAGEPGASLGGVRDAICKKWGDVEIYDHYGMSEVGPVAVQLPAGGDMKILRNRYYAELVDSESGECLGCEGEGELVLTPLGRYDCPVLRYRTGDLVEMKICDGEQVLVGGIKGRVDDMVVVRGVNIYPGVVDDLLSEFDEVEEYQGVVDSRGVLTEFLLRVEFKSGVEGAYREAVCETISKRFERMLALRISVEVVESGKLPRSEFKSRRWVKL